MHLVVDVANQVILPQGKLENVDSWFKRIDKRLSHIIVISKHMRLKPIFVCDAGYTTKEVKDKWKSRREKEVQKCYRKIPYCADTMVCELILKRNLNLVFDRRYNADDIVATLAGMHSHSKILSRDTDYFRYNHGEFRDKVYFFESSMSLQRLIPYNTIRAPLQTIRMYIPIFCKSFCDLSKFVFEGEYKRGTVFPLAERSIQSSLHLASRSIRQLLYTNTVHETFPIFDEETSKVVWIMDDVEPISGVFPSSIDEIEQTIKDNIPEVINNYHGKTIRIMAAELFAEKYKVSLISLVFCLP